MAVFSVGTGGDYATLQTCMASGAVADGDTVQILSGYNVTEQVGPGVTWPDNVVVQGDVSTPSNAQLTWDNPTAASDSYVILINNGASGVKFSGLKIRYTGSATTDSTCYRGGWSGHSDIVFEDCELISHGIKAMRIVGADLVVRRCRVDNTPNTASTTTVGIWASTATIESCLLIGWTKNALVTDTSTVKNTTIYNGKASALIHSAQKAIWVLGNGTTIANCVIQSVNSVNYNKGILANSSTLTGAIAETIVSGFYTDIQAAGFTQTNVTTTSTLGSSAVLADPSSGDYYPAVGGVAINGGDASYAPSGGDLNGLSFASPPSIGCLEELVADTGGVTNARSKVLNALRYGWGLLYWIKIEGVPTICAEKITGKTVSGYQCDGSLIIDAGSKVGSIVDRETGLGRAFDLTIQLLDTATTRAMFRKPTKFATLGETLAHDDTTAATVTTAETTWGTDYAGGSVFYVGNERVTFASTTGSPITSFDTLTRASTDWKAYTHNENSALSTYVTNAPQWYRGRRIELYATPVDPLGNVNEAALDTVSVQLWAGNIETDPRVNRDGVWNFKCRPLERRLAQPSTVDASGLATFGTSDDTLVDVEGFACMRWFIKTAFTSTVAATEFQFKPFAGLTGPIRFSDARARIKAAFDAAVPAGIASYVRGMQWAHEFETLPSGAVVENWRALIEVMSATTDDIWYIDYAWDGGWLPGPFPQRDYAGAFVVVGEQPTVASPNWSKVGSPLVCSSQSITIGSLDVKVEEGNASALPTTGFVRLEADDRKVVLPYKGLVLQGQIVRLTVDRDKGPELGFGLGGDFLTSGIKGEVDCTFIHSDTGRIQDTMRAHIMSSGRGNNDATHDRLPQGQGMDIEAVDVASFETNLDGMFGVLGSLLLQVDSGTTFSNLYSGLLALSQRAVVSRTNAATGALELAAVRTGVANTANTVATVTDEDVARVGKSQAIRPKPTTVAPNSIELTVKGYDEAHLFASDVPAMRAQGVKRKAYSAHGVSRYGLTVPFYAWSQGLFSAARNAQAIEVDVAPWVEFGTIGDIIRLETSHYSVWSRDTGAPTYAGAARVLGVQFDLKRQIFTLTLLIDGATGGAMSLSPSAPVDAWDSATAPTYLDIPHSYLQLMANYLDGVASFDLLVYVPGSDAADVTVTVSAVADFETYVRLTVSAISGSGAASLSLTTSHRLTLPITADSNAAQLRHMHTDSDTRWI